MPVFPIPFIRHISPGTPHSRHIQQRQHIRQHTINAANLVIQSLNAVHSPSSVHPFHIPFLPCETIYSTLYKHDYTTKSQATKPFASSYSHPTTTQQRIHDHIYMACRRMLQVGHRDTDPVSLSDGAQTNNTRYSKIPTSVFTEGIALELDNDFLKSFSL